MLYRYHPRIHLARSTRKLGGGEVDLRLVNLRRGNLMLPLRSRDTSSSGSGRCCRCHRRHRVELADVYTSSVVWSMSARASYEH